MRMVKDKKSRGISLYIILVVLSVLFLIALGLSLLLWGQLKIVVGVEESVIAFFAADAGMEKRLYDSFSEGKCFSARDSGSLSISNASFEIETECNSDYYDDGPCSDYCSDCLRDGDGSCQNAARYCSISRGSFGSTTRAIEVDY